MVIAKHGLILSATALVLTGVTVIGAGIHLSSQASLSNNAPKELIDQVWHIIDRTYVDGTFNQVDWKATRTEYLDKTYTSDEQAYNAIREMLERLGDPYTRFMDPREFKNMQIDTSGELTGVGIQLTQDQDTKKLVVISPIEDTPAFDAGIQAKDIITKIDGQSTHGMDINKAVSLIRGPIGSQVILSIKRENREIEFPIIRAKIEIHPVKYSQKESSFLSREKLFSCPPLV